MSASCNFQQSNPDILFFNPHSFFHDTPTAYFRTVGKKQKAHHQARSLEEVGGYEKPRWVFASEVIPGFEPRTSLDPSGRNDSRSQFPT